MIQTSRDTWASHARRWLPAVLLSGIGLVSVPAFALSQSAPAPEAHQPAATATGHDAPATPAASDHAADHAQAGSQPASPTADHTAPAQTAAAPHGDAPAHAATDSHGQDHSGDHGEGHGESLGSFLSRIANFLILAGGLFYLLRSPLAKYLDSRAHQIKADLVTAGETRKAAAEELAQIESRMQQLPGEIEALKARGVQEVQAEQERIRQAAAVERERLLEQARREIDGQLAGARRVLKQDAADLAVNVARRRIEHEITDADRARLVDRYVAQVKTAHD
jgi:F-type H+-transporting ATPase subunit b